MLSYVLIIKKTRYKVIDCQLTVLGFHPDILFHQDTDKVLTHSMTIKDKDYFLLLLVDVEW